MDKTIYYQNMFVVSRIVIILVSLSSKDGNLHGYKSWIDVTYKIDTNLLTAFLVI